MIFNKHVRPACLSNTNDLESNISVISTKWERRNNSSELSDIPIKFQLNFISNTECQKYIKPKSRRLDYKLIKSQLCATVLDSGENTCQVLNFLFIYDLGFNLIL